MTDPVLSPDRCFWHERDEPLRPGDFRVCGECWHVWRTREAFEADVEWSAWEAGIPFQPPDQPFCPLCVHDF